MGKVYRAKNSASGDLVSYYYDNDSSSSILTSNINEWIKNAVIRQHYRLNLLNSDPKSSLK